MEQLTELAIRVFSDKHPDDDIQSITISAHTIDNYKPVINKALEIYSQKNIPVIINGANAISGYVGSSEYKKTFIASGLSEQDIIIAEPESNEMLHTRNESIAYVKTLLKHQFSNTYLVSTPFHQLRAFMTMVTIASEMNANIKIYNCPVLNFNWNQIVTHSQGTLKKVAKDLINEEFSRIDKYQAKGDLASPELVLQYLNNRD